MNCPCQYKHPQKANLDRKEHQRETIKISFLKRHYKRLLTQNCQLLLTFNCTPWYQSVFEIPTPVHSQKFTALTEGFPVLHDSSPPHSCSFVRVRNLDHFGHTLDYQDMNLPFKSSKKLATSCQCKPL